MALYENGKRISGIRDFPAYTWAEYHALPVAKRPKVWKCTDRDYTEIPDVFYNDVAVAGTSISGGYAQINTGISSDDYLPLAVLDGAYWDEKCVYSLRSGTTNIFIFVKCTASSHTISASVDPVRVLCVKKSRLNATPIS